MRQTEDHSRRFWLAYGAASLAVAAMALGWGIFFALGHAWALVGIDVAVIAVALMSFLLAHRRQLSAALLFSQVSFFVIILVFCLVFDVPNAAAPRVTHIFLLVLALLGYINHQRERSHLQVIIIVLCLVSFIVFSSTHVTAPVTQPIADEFRTLGTWVNTIIAVALLCGGIYVMQLKFAQNLDQARDIKAALTNREFELFYQPQVDEAGKVSGAEALLRRKRQGGGYISPGEFIPAAEQAGLMPALGDWVLGEACRTLAFWQQEEATRHLKLSVNVSVDQFMKADFVETLMARIAARDLDPTRLKLELTESMMVDDVDLIVEKMRALRAAGIILSLDDFGTGYSSLSHLRQLPIHEIKIDRSFVQDAPQNKRNRILLKSIFDIARMLEFSVVAEGIETKEQLLLLQSFGCTIFQGYYFGRPVPLAEFQSRWANDAPPPAEPA
ncbi:putative bifunctional diguanylate cyclase/phosphodiesterase [Shinella sp. M31]|uniref:putative bifunctional diguanylate cyclase/phosphodiesterase n=1 Tax=Shinella sp. M31 TaxID=3368615 RepID=UPI003BA3899F